MTTSSGTVTLLAATTSAVASDSFQATQKGQHITLRVTGLATTEKAYFQWKNTAGTFIDYEIDGAIPYFDKDSHVITIDNEDGEYRVNKEASAGAVDVVLISRDPVTIYVAV